ncbi:alpha-1,4-glucan--maltose-1-phosphate maltosyltransferase [Corynebacterium pseudopelargi]|uniref:Alpha-1,4-glucan:maltose-1-phosphate maltosyltransferase n=1 Tax=Corynebacterium pseudopelargi TaxID=2080757 RepID=A0A3G6IXS6_9CORY|nr:alpha-1,4-glucan--maltose-1-phosphate maltosyltransferase [Corynebacterium pseudopelargi]AZA09458.1 Alpha-1,4-glucan:maltose-1-phosphate maltosyltransferase [Corynebacterium pseudopelargi]
MIGRLAIEDVRPKVSGRSQPSKAVVGEVVAVSALIWREGHDVISATLNLTAPDGSVRSTTMVRDPFDQDKMHATFSAEEAGHWSFRVDAWSDPIATWRHAVTTKIEAGQSEAELANDLAHGVELFEAAAKNLKNKKDKAALHQAADALRSDDALRARVAPALSHRVSKILEAHPLRELLTRGEEHPVLVERKKAQFSSWYELFPRSTGGWDEHGNPIHGTFASTADALERVARMGFDTVYFPPIHPIGKLNRKGRNNTLIPEPEDVGSPWAIGSAEGGHDATHPELGTLKDFAKLMQRAEALGLEVALDLALQAAPDHPWAKSHPEFFTVLADGTIAYAENPPKKYQDIYPLNFDNAPEKIYKEILRVVEFWIAQGVHTFRVDNPHTKPTNFWHWLISTVHEQHPEVIFLAEAFTRPARLYGLAKAGFSQSYTYFTWKTTKEELEEFGQDIAAMADVMRPNLFVNTPDILHASLQYGGPAMFAIRATLASTMSPLWGVYSGFEIFEHRALHHGSEEYLDSEKFQLRPRDFDGPLHRNESLEPYLTLLNQIRRDHPALQQQRILDFHPTSNEKLLAYSKVDPASGNAVLVVVNLDSEFTQEGTVDLRMDRIGQEDYAEFQVRDLVSAHEFPWRKHTFVRLDPHSDVAHILELPDVRPEAREQLAWRNEVDYHN